MLLSAEHLYKDYGTKKLFEDVSLFLPERERIGLIGVNGAGKSTLLRVLAGEEAPDRGTVTAARNAKISYLPQNPRMNDGATVLEQVFLDQSAAFRELKEYEVKTMLNRLGIPDFSAKVGTLSGGQRKRVALAAALIRPAEILILDEPTNHLDSDMVAELEERLKKFSGGLIMVTHDRYFLERVVNRITELTAGKLFHYEANYSRYLELKAEQSDMENASERKRQSVLRREYEWISRGARARSTKSRERIARYEALKEESAPEAAQRIEMDALSSRMGKKLIELNHVQKSFGEACVVRDFSYHVQREDRIGVVGKNGVGKSTLLNLIAGRFPPDSGSIETGSTIRIGYFAQENRELDPEMRPYDLVREVASEVETREGTFSVSQMMERFLFDPTMQYSKIKLLSGGEKRRLYLLSILAAAPNVLLLDEPTNDLDITTLSILEEYLASFPGAVIAVSHDRYFLDRVATSIFEVEEGGIITRYSGNYADYLEKRAAAQKPDAPEKPQKESRAERPREGDKPRKLKFTFREQREFESIDGEIAALESAVAECEQLLAASQSDYVKLMESTERLKTLQAELAQKTDRWVYLNELAEKIEAQEK